MDHGYGFSCVTWTHYCTWPLLIIIPTIWPRTSWQAVLRELNAVFLHIAHTDCLPAKLFFQAFLFFGPTEHVCYSPISAKQAHFLLNPLTHGQLQTILLFCFCFSFVFVTLPELYFSFYRGFLLWLSKRESLCGHGGESDIAKNVFHNMYVNKKILLKRQNYRTFWNGSIKWDKTWKQIASSSGKKQHCRDK